MTNDAHTPHPLDWATYLRRPLVLSSAPTALTLLVVVAHCHALCGSARGGAGLLWPNTSATTAVGNETTSVLGTLFFALQFFNASSSCIPTPWNPPHSHQQPVMAVKSEDVVDHNNNDESKLQQEGSSGGSMRLDSILRASVMKDPFTIAYGAWEFFAGPVEQIQIEPVSNKQKQKPTSCEWTFRDKREQARKTKENNDQISTSWLNICVMHSVGMLGIFCALLPSIFVRKRELLACNFAVPSLKATAWPLLHSCAILFGLSWVACAAVHHVAGLPELAVCTSMHLVAQLVCAFVDMAASCPLPPIFYMGSSKVAATGMGFSLGLLLLCISQMEEDGDEEVSSFYMNHVWAAWGAVFVVRSVLCSRPSSLCV